ncbi:MAG: DUF177 domain-containing protein [Prevotellaceae bacterium]|nr:DUF177 domain-containing protein [Prevotellaceae bacterium]MDO4931224.1 DUF177 domain-containing protein [Prevotellaceae bacterium]
MFRTEELNIDVLALQEDSFEATYILRDEYFQSLDDSSIQHGDVCAEVCLRKTSHDEYSLSIKIAGMVTVPCDRCLDDMDQHVQSESTYTIRLGSCSDVNEDVITVSEEDGILPLAWLIYETIALAIPIKHVHAPGKCNVAMTEKLKELSATRSGDGDADDEVDPRWAALDKLKS